MNGELSSLSSPFMFIFDGPVSCSKLFGKLLSTHPQLQPIHGYPYLLAATRGPSQIPARLTSATEQRLRDKWQREVRDEDLKRWALMTFEQANEEVAVGIKAIEELGKMPVVQEHAAICIRADISLECLRQQSSDPGKNTRYNPTVIDDSIIHNCIPIILIRHPALYIPSFYRKQKKESMLDLDDEAFQLWISLKWVRILYEYFLNSASQMSPDSEKHGRPGKSEAPVVVDAEDVVHHTQSLAHKLGTILGINPDGVKFTWKPSTNEAYPEGVVASFHERLRNSTGVERDNVKILDGDINIEDRMQSWAEEFGLRIAEEIRSRVDAEMPTYWYLRNRKL